MMIPPSPARRSPNMFAKAASYIYRESGLSSVVSTGRDAWFIIFARSSRMFAYGSSSLILALFFAELEVSDSHIGLFMTLTLLGDVVLSLILTLIADRLGRRRTLLSGAVLMIMSGAAFALCENYWVLLFAAVVGVISATGGDFGPFRAIEESTLSELTNPSTRADVLSWYVMTASLGSSVGTEVAGKFIEWLRSKHGWSLVDAYHACFWVYVVMGSVNVLSSLALSKKCELKQPEEAAGVEADPWLDSSGRPNKPRDNEPPKSSKWSQIGRISRETRSFMYKLWFLLMVDSLADGMVSVRTTPTIRV